MCLQGMFGVYELASVEVRIHHLNSIHQGAAWLRTAQNHITEATATHCQHSFKPKVKVVVCGYALKRDNKNLPRATKNQEYQASGFLRMRSKIWRNRSFLRMAEG